MDSAEWYGITGPARSGQAEDVIARVAGWSEPHFLRLGIGEQTRSVDQSGKSAASRKSWKTLENAEILKY